MLSEAKHPGKPENQSRVPMLRFTQHDTPEADSRF